MDNTLFGISLVYWGILALGIAGAYFYLWPRPSPNRSKPRTAWQHIVLRYFHSLVWVLLAFACFIGALGPGEYGRWVALAAIPVYIVFMVMLVRDRNREMAQLAAQRKAQNTGGEPDKTTS